MDNVYYSLLWSVLNFKTIPSGMLEENNDLSCGTYKFDYKSTKYVIFYIINNINYWKYLNNMEIKIHMIIIIIFFRMFIAMYTVWSYLTVCTNVNVLYYLKQTTFEINNYYLLMFILAYGGYNTNSYLMYTTFQIKMKWSISLPSIIAIAHWNFPQFVWHYVQYLYNTYNYIISTLKTIKYAYAYIICLKYLSNNCQNTHNIYIVGEFPSVSNSSPYLSRPYACIIMLIE